MSTPEAPARRTERLLSNIFHAFASRVLLLVVGLVTVPYVVNRLGLEAYALYSMVAVVIGYLSFLDLGMGPALVKHLSEARALQDDLRVMRLLQTGALVFLSAAAAGGAAIAASASLLARTIVQVSPALAEAAPTVFRLAGVSFALAMLLNGLLSIPQACQRLDIVARFTFVLGLLAMVTPVVLLWAGQSLITLVVGGLGVSLLGVVYLAALARRLLPGHSMRPRFHGEEARALVKFGSATLLGSIAAQTTLQVDKLVIGACLPMSGLSYYAVPYNLAAKFLMVPQAVGPALFPAVSEEAATGAEERIRSLYLRTMKVLLACILPLAALFLVYGPKFLAYWVGRDFAVQGGDCLRILTLAFLVMVMTQPAGDVARGIGKPGLGALLAAIDAVLVVGLCVLFVPRSGIQGAAFALLLGTAGGSLLFVFLVQRNMLRLGTWEVFRCCCWQPLLSAAAYAALLLLCDPVVNGLPSLCAVGGIATLAYAVAVVYVVLSPWEREALRSWAGRRRSTPGAKAA